MIRSALFVFALGFASLLGATQARAVAVNIYGDTFTAADNTGLVGRAPELSMGVAGAVYGQHNGGWNKDIQGNQARIGADTGVSLPLAGLTIGPDRPLRVSAILDLNDIAGPGSPSNMNNQRGIGLGFYTSTGGVATANGWNGVQLSTDGRLIVSQQNAAGANRAGFIAEIATGVNLAAPHALSYDIDPATGDISNIFLDGVQQPDVATSIFTSAAVQRVGMMVSSQAGGTHGFADDFAVSAPNLAPIPGLFNTGVDANGDALAAGADDPHYTLTMNPNGADNIPAVVQSGIPSPPWVANNAFSQWVGPVENTQNIDTGGTFEYTLTFDLTGLDPATASINGDWASDNPSGDILINGMPTGLANTGFGSLTNFEITSGFQSGVNTLTFQFANGDAPGDFTGLRVDNLVGFAVPVPEPATATLALSSLGLLIGRRRTWRVVGG